MERFTNGFVGGPFFTSSEDHTIADVKDQKRGLLERNMVIKILKEELHMSISIRVKMRQIIF